MYIESQKEKSQKWGKKKKNTEYLSSNEVQGIKNNQNIK